MIDVTGVLSNSGNAPSLQGRFAGFNPAGHANKIALLAACVLLAGTALSAPAQAQFFPRFWDEPVYVERGYRDVMPRGAVHQMLRERGFAFRAPLRRNGRVYVADVVNPRGIRMRIIIDSYNGRIVQRFVQGGPPRPPRDVGRRYSSRAFPDLPFDAGPDAEPPPFAETPPVVAPPTVRKGKNVRSKKARRSKPSRSGSAIVRRELPPAKASAPDAAQGVLGGVGDSGNSVSSAPSKKPAIAAPQPARVTPRVVYPGAPVVKPAVKPVAVRNEPAAPAAPIARVAPAKPAVVTIPKVAAPTIVPPAQGKKPLSTAARSQDDPVAKPKPKVRFVKPEKPAVKPAEQQARRSILPPPAPPAAVNVPVEQTAKRSARPRVRVVPLDNPGPRRDVQKPVATAPLQ